MRLASLSLGLYSVGERGWAKILLTSLLILPLMSHRGFHVTVRCAGKSSVIDRGSSIIPLW